MILLCRLPRLQHSAELSAGSAAKRGDMERILTLIIERPVAACAGVFGMLCFAAYPLARGRSLMLTTYLGNNLGFAAHYALLGQVTAVTMNLMLGVQSLVALGLARWPRLRWTYYALMPILLVASAMTWQVVAAVHNGNHALHLW